MNTVFAIDRHGRRRPLGPNDMLEDGERLSVSLTAMDSAAPQASPQAAAEAAYARMKAEMHYLPPTPAGAALSAAEADRIAADAVARSRGGQVGEEAKGAYLAMKHLMNTAGGR
jgi:hypothetical protein